MPRSYAVTALATFFLVLACIVLFCLSVNPYRLFPEIPRLSPNTSVDVFHYLRLYKPYAVERTRPDHLVLGSSRAARLAPQPLGVAGGSTYNAALPAATLWEIRRSVEHAHATKPVTSVLISLDHYMFQAVDGIEIDQDLDARWRKPGAGLPQKLQHWYQQFEDYWRSLLSVDALLDSWRALAAEEPSKREYREDGTWNVTSGAVDPLILYSMNVQRQHHEYTAGDPSLVLDELEELLSFLVANDIKTSLLISPMQGLIMHTVHVAGGWQQYFDWQRALVALTAAYGADLTLYGMEDNPLLVLEGIRAEDPMFIDGVHTTRKVGREVSACVAAPCESALRPTRLDEQSIEPYLQRVDLLRRQYERDNPTDLARVHAWLQRDIPSGFFN